MIALLFSPEPVPEPAGNGLCITDDVDMYIADIALIEMSAVRTLPLPPYQLLRQRLLPSRPPLTLWPPSAGYLLQVVVVLRMGR